MTSLPAEPGLARRTAYSEQVRLRNLRLRVSTVSAAAQIVFENAGSRTLHTNLLYDDLIELPVVKIGLNVADLKRSSSVGICIKPFFCSICQEHMKAHSEVYRTLGCGHSFHIDCVDEWLKDNYTCPLCKFSLRTHFF
jgi:hypothetical protein